MFFMTKTAPPTNTAPAQAEIGLRLGIVLQLFSGEMARRLEPHGLTYPQFALLMHLARQPTPQRVSDLVQAVEMTQSAVTKAVQKFQKMGVVAVSRDGMDQRNRPIEATEKGQALLGAVLDDLAPVFDHLLDGWQGAEVERLNSDLARLIRGFEVLRAGA